MNSPFAKMFLSLQTRIAAITSGSPATQVFPFIDQNLKQYHIKQRPAVAFPAVLIDFENWKFENMGDNCQTAQGDVVITLLFAPYSNTDENTPEQYKELALGYYEEEQLLHLALQGFAPANYGRLTRTGSSPELVRPDMRIRRIVYAMDYEDYSTSDAPTIVHAPAVVTPEFLP